MWGRVNPMKKLKTPGLLTASLVLLGVAAVGCGGGGAPTDASEDKFCKELTSLFNDPSQIADMTDKEALDQIKAWAKDLEKVGTPKNISDEGREGFELMVEQVDKLDTDDTAADLDKLEEGLSDSEKKASEAFEKYTTDTCGQIDIDTPDLPELDVPEIDVPEIPAPS